MKRAWKNNRTRLIAALLALLLVVSLAACGRSSKPSGSGSDTSSASGTAEPTGSPTAEPTATPAPPETTTIATVVDIEGPLNIRDRPSTEDSEVIGQANSGDRFEVSMAYCDEGRAWHEIFYKDAEGGKAYVSSEFTEISQGTLEGGSVPTPEPTKTPTKDNPIIVNGSGRPDTSAPSSDEGLTPDTLRAEEDPAKR